MIRKLVLPVRKLLSGTLRKLFNFLPRERRFAVYRNFVDCDPAPDETVAVVTACGGCAQGAVPSGAAWAGILAAVAARARRRC